jgi:hypothetical protein
LNLLQAILGREISESSPRIAKIRKRSRIFSAQASSRALTGKFQYHISSFEAAHSARRPMANSFSWPSQQKGQYYRMSRNLSGLSLPLAAHKITFQVRANLCCP